MNPEDDNSYGDSLYEQEEHFTPDFSIGDCIAGLGLVVFLVFIIILIAH